MKNWVVFRLTFAASSASAGEINIKLPDDTEVTTNAVLYKCGEKNVSVTYYNAGDISLAELELEDETVVASNVISGSGAKYAGVSISGGPRARRPIFITLWTIRTNQSRQTV